MGERGVLRAGPVVAACGLVAAVATLLWSSATGDVPFAAVLVATFVLVVSTFGLVLSLGIGTERWTWVERWGGWVFAAVLGVLVVSNALDRNWVLASLAAVLALLQVRAQLRRKRPAVPAQDWPVERVRETLSTAGLGPGASQVEAVAHLRRADPGLGLAEAVDLVRRARGEHAPRRD